MVDVDSNGVVVAVEDDPYSVVEYYVALQGKRLRVIPFNDAGKALEYIERHKVDLVILDICMDPPPEFEVMATHGGFATGHLLGIAIRLIRPDLKLLAFSQESSRSEAVRWFKNQKNSWVIRKDKDRVAQAHFADAVMAMLGGTINEGASFKDLFEGASLELWPFQVRLDRVYEYFKSRNSKGKNLTE